MWSLGVTLYEMLVGGPPFRGMTREEIVANALSLNYDTRPEALSVEARQLVDAMLQVLPSDRASVAELCVEQVDVGCALYRIQAPAGMEEFFIFPSVTAGALNHARWRPMLGKLQIQFSWLRFGRPGI